ncbi:MAG: zinc-dependent peptidase [Methylococcaceae bacterium]|nr:zinc-dependent peptidase [Methylococcaceae bacterium]
MWLLTRLRNRKILRNHLLATPLWEEILASHPILAGLNDEEAHRLRELTTLFLHHKIFEPAQGLLLTEPMRERIAVQCCLPVLNLGLDWLDGWRTVIVYPGEFIRPREQFDAIGVMHQWDEIVSGEAWRLGPIILSWADMEASGLGEGYNVAIHEIAHKLDQLNGEVDGFPPLHRTMRARSWTSAFEAAFEDFKQRLETGAASFIDPYAAEEPGEFFAVLSELFFEWPDRVMAQYPDVYRQLAAFYRQDPLARFMAAGQG